MKLYPMRRPPQRPLPSMDGPLGLRGFSLEKLLEIMVKLGRDVEIGFSKSSKKEGSRYFIRNEKVRTPVAA